MNMLMVLLFLFISVFTPHSNGLILNTAKCVQRPTNNMCLMTENSLTTGVEDEQTSTLPYKLLKESKSTGLLENEQELISTENESTNGASLTSKNLELSTAIENREEQSIKKRSLESFWNALFPKKLFEKSTLEHSIKIEHSTEVEPFAEVEHSTEVEPSAEVEHSTKDVLVTESFERQLDETTTDNKNAIEEAVSEILRTELSNNKDMLDENLFHPKILIQKISFLSQNVQ